MLALDAQASPFVAIDFRDAEGRVHLDRAAFDQGAPVDAEFAPGRQRIGRLAAERGLDLLLAHDPDDPRLRGILAQGRQVDQHVQRRMAAAEDGHGAAGIAAARAAEHVGDAGRDPRPGGHFPQGRQAVRAGRVGRVPGARRIDDRARLDVPKRTVRARYAQHEGPRLATGRAHLVDALAGDRDDAGIEADMRGQRRQGGERFQIAGHQLGAGRHLLVRRVGPAGSRQQQARLLVDAVAPGREHPHMAPLADAACDRRAGLEHQRDLAPVQEMDGGGQPDGAGADDGDRQLRCGHWETFRGDGAGASGMQGAAAPGNAMPGGQAERSPPQQFSVRKPTRAFIASYSAA